MIAEASNENDAVRKARALWRDAPEVVADVGALRTRFIDAPVCVPETLCDSHAAADTAFVLVDVNFRTSVLSYGELAEQSKRLAGALQARGVQRGTRVGVLMGKSAQLPIVLLAIWRLGAVHVPLFTAFAPPAIAARLAGAEAALVIVDKDQRFKLDGLPLLQITAGGEVAKLIRDNPPFTSSVFVDPNDFFIQIYTSGTTGKPKAVGVPAFAIASFISYMRYGLNVTESDVFWNAADPGWAYGLYYGIVGPLAIGRPNILLDAPFSTRLISDVITACGVTNLAASPTVYRALKRDAVTASRPLRVASSAGEPLTADVTAWSIGALGTHVHDHWGQTEHGMAIVNAWHPNCRAEVRVGSMGPALPGFTAGTVGESIALDVDHSDLMWFGGYVDAPVQTTERFTSDGRWYLTGDIGRHDGTHFYFASRDDDVILAAGYRIAPFDIETIIAADDAVAEVAVVGHPDAIRGEVVEAFVVLTAGATDAGLTERLQQAVRDGYGAHAYPRSVHILETLPKTPSGKVQRFLLRQSPPSSHGTTTDNHAGAH